MTFIYDVTGKWDDNWPQWLSALIKEYCPPNTLSDLKLFTLTTNKLYYYVAIVLFGTSI